MAIYSDYDAFAWVYNKHWSNRFTPTALAVLEKLVLPRLLICLRCTKRLGRTDRRYQKGLLYLSEATIRTEYGM